MEKSNLNITPPTVIILDGPTRVKDCTELQQIGSLSWSIAGKPVVRHIIEELQQIGVENCFTLSSGGAKGISQLVRDELHWSNRMRIEILDYELDATAALRLFATLADTSNLLLIEPGLFTECCITTFFCWCNSKQPP